MKHIPIEMLPNRPPPKVAGRLSRSFMASAQAAVICLGVAISSAQRENSGADEQGAQVLTRGPVHEAFAGIVSYNPEPGVIVEMAPPNAIEELPPGVRPEGDNITWIPGYWGWDDERTDYLWISGTWRALPPGRQWTTGYWSTAGQGHQWTSGYWADSSVQETTYLPKPPITVEVGPNIAAPSRAHGWTPGSWVWRQERYAWTPGYWAQGRSDWDWIPAHYVWTRRGYVFVDGYWDYSFARRGVLYAPVYFQSGYYSRPGFSYSPVIAIGLVAMMEHLFLRPNYQHYYFGDYYDRRYSDRGYYSPYAYQSGRYGYDPVYSYQIWSHRDDRDWERRHRESYDYRRDNESSRPPRTWDDQNRLKLDTEESREQQMMIAAPLDQMAKQKDSPLRIQQVPDKERQQLKERGMEVGKIREQRRELETKGLKDVSGKSEREFKPSKVRLPASPIVGRSRDRFDEKQAPPQPQRTTADETGDQPKDARKDQPGAERRDQPKDERREEKTTPNRAPEPEKTRPDVKRQPEPRGPETKKEQPARPREAIPQPKKPQPEPERRVEKPTRPEPPSKVREPERKTQESPRRTEKTQENPSEPSKPKETDNQDQNRERPDTRSESSEDKEDSATGRDAGKRRK